MEARLLKIAALAVLLLVAMGARFQGANFVVETADPKLAEQFDRAAEQYRRDLAVLWLGQTMANWAQPCTMTVQVGPHLGAGGATSFVFDRGEVFGWRMNIQGSAERVLDSVLPRDHAHGLRDALPPPLAPLGRRGRGDQHGVPQRKGETPHDALAVPPHGAGDRLRQMFAMTEYPARRHAAVRRGLFAGRVSDPARRAAEVRAVPRRRPGVGPVVGGRPPALRRGRPGDAAKHLAGLGSRRLPRRARDDAVAAAAAPQAMPLADARRPRPAPNLLYRDRGGDAKLVSHTAAVNPTAEAAVLPAAGWHAHGPGGCGGRECDARRRGSSNRDRPPAGDRGGQADGLGIRKAVAGGTGAANTGKAGATQDSAAVAGETASDAAPLAVSARCPSRSRRALSATSASSG